MIHFLTTNATFMLYCFMSNRPATLLLVRKRGATSELWTLGIGSATSLSMEYTVHVSLVIYACLFDLELYRLNYF